MPNLNVTLPAEIIKEIEARSSGDGRKTGLLGKSEVVDRDLTRYYTGLDRARRKLAKLFTPNEAAALCDNLNGVWLTHNPEIAITGIPLNVAEGIELNGLDAKWELDAPEFLRKLNALSFLGLCAIADCVERFWLDPQADPKELFNVTA